MRKLSILGLLLIASMSASDKIPAESTVEKTAIISVFSVFPRGINQLILDYYGKHWVVALATINYHEKHVEAGHPTLQALKFRHLKSERQTNDEIGLTGYFATHVDLQRCTYIEFAIPSVQIIYWNTRAFKKEREEVWQTRIPGTAPEALSSCGMYKAYVDDFKLPAGGASVRVLKKEKDLNYSQLATILDLQDKEKIEDVSFD